MGEINYAPLIDDMVWSYSRIKAFVDCPYRFYLKYIRHIHGKEMFFASYGTFMHKLIETYFKEGKSPRQLTDIYLRDFKKEVNLVITLCVFLRLQKLKLVSFLMFIVLCPM